MKNAKEKQEKEPAKVKVKGSKKIKVSVMLFLISVVPIIVSIFIIMFQSVQDMKKSMETQVEDTLYVAASNLSTHCSGADIHGGNVGTYNEYMDCLKQQGIELGIILEGGSGTSSIKNKNDFREREIEFGKEVPDFKDGFFTSGVTIADKDYYGYYMPITTEGQTIAVAFAGKEQSVIDSALSKNIKQAMVLAVALAAVFTVVSVLAGNYLARSVKSVAKSVDALSKGDLSIQKLSKSSLREMDKLLVETRMMQENLAATIGGVQDVSLELTRDIVEMSASSSSTASRANQITSAMEDLSASAGGMAENVQNINIKMSEIDNCINDISVDVEHLYDNSKNLLHSNEDAKANMAEIMENSSKSVDAVNGILEQIKETNASITEIDKAVGIILDISEQTNLLSLNASIEAARAGELGRGFAVVASEIGKLAMQSAEGAEMIKNMAQTIIKKSEASVELAEGITNLIETEQDSVSNTQKKFEELSMDINSSVSKISNIAEKTETLNNYKEKVIDNVQELSAISEENYASSEEVSANVMEIIQEVELVNQKCNKINTMAGQLEKSASYFQV